MHYRQSLLVALAFGASAISAQESSSIPGGCNPAHPGSCPSSYFDTTSSVAPSFTSISGIPGGCNPAHPGSCPSSYFDTTATASFSSISGIPGGCNPAHPGSCPSSYFDTTSTTASFSSISGIPGGCNPAHPGSCPSSYFDTTSSATATSAKASATVFTTGGVTKTTSSVAQFTGGADRVAAMGPLVVLGAVAAIVM